MFRRVFPALIVILVALAAPAVFAQGTGVPGGSPPANLQPCASGQQPSPTNPCLPPTCAQGQVPSPTNVCLPPACAQGQVPTQTNPCLPSLPTGGPGGGGPTGGGGQLQPCADGQQPTPQTPCLPAGGFSGGGQVICSGGGSGPVGAGGDGGDTGSRDTGGGGGGSPCANAGAGGGGTPALSGAFLSRIWKMNADADSYDGANNVLNCTVTKFLNLPKRFSKMDDDLIDTDAYVLFGPTTRVYGTDGKRIPKETRYDTLLDNAETVKIEAKVVPPKSWQKDEDGNPTPTFRAKKVYILS
jgi:hypothetical protein